MKDCFAYRNSRRCAALKVKRCAGCNFYKSNKQYLLDRQKALERIVALDKDKRDHIMKTYYDGRLEV